MVGLADLQFKGKPIAVRRMGWGGGGMETEKLTVCECEQKRV